MKQPKIEKQVKIIDAKKQMSKHAAYVRDIDEMKKLHEKLSSKKADFFEKNQTTDADGLPALHKRYDALVTQVAVLSAMIFSAENIGSRGSALVNGKAADTGKYDDKIIITKDGRSYFEPVRPIPPCDDWFENVWSDSAADD